MASAASDTTTANTFSWEEVFHSSRSEHAEHARAVRERVELQLQELRTDRTRRAGGIAPHILSPCSPFFLTLKAVLDPEVLLDEHACSNFLYRALEQASRKSQAVYLNALLAKGIGEARGQIPLWPLQHTLYFVIVDNGSEDVLLALLHTLRAHDPITTDLLLAILHGNQAAAIVLANGALSPNLLHEAVTLAFRKGHQNVVIALLTRRIISPAQMHHWLRIAARNNHLDVIQALLDRVVLPPDELQEFFLWAVQHHAPSEAIQVLLDRGDISNATLERALGHSRYPSIIAALARSHGEGDAAH